jgi:hypothetical protein
VTGAGCGADAGGEPDFARLISAFNRLILAFHAAELGISRIDTGAFQDHILRNY